MAGGSGEEHREVEKCKAALDSPRSFQALLTKVRGWVWAFL